jgi:hypothetical protein
MSSFAVTLTFSTLLALTLCLFSILERGARHGRGGEARTPEVCHILLPSPSPRIQVKTELAAPLF